MTPHNTGLTGSRDDLLLRFRARTFPQLLQYCWRLGTGFLIACFILHLLLDFFKWRLPIVRANVAKFITYKLSSTHFQAM